MTIEPFTQSFHIERKSWPLADTSPRQAAKDSLPRLPARPARKPLRRFRRYPLKLRSAKLGWGFTKNADSHTRTRFRCRPNQGTVPRMQGAHGGTSPGAPSFRHARDHSAQFLNSESNLHAARLSSPNPERVSVHDRVLFVNSLTTSSLNRQADELSESDGNMRCSRLLDNVPPPRWNQRSP